MDIDTKHSRLAEIIQGTGSEGILLQNPVNFSWLTSGGTIRGIADETQAPVLYLSPEGRWVISANVDTQRIFDEELDGLGFQLKEWPWYLGKEQLLADLCHNRKVVSDLSIQECEVVEDQIAKLRRKHTPYERACYRALGQLVGHALEATARTFNQGESEREVAGQIAHRLIHRGAMPLVLTVMADSRSQQYRQGGFTSTAIKSHCVMLVAAQKYGLCAMASRSVSFGEPTESFRKDHDGGSRVAATFTASSWPDAMPKQVLATAQKVYEITGAEHEWRLCPQGHITGRKLVEIPITPQTEELLQNNWAVTWRASVGSSLCVDTFLITEEGPRTITVADQWPLKRIRIQGAEFVRPDILVR